MPNKTPKPSDENEPGLSLFNALILEKAEEVGGLKAYAANLGINYPTLWRWMKRETDVFGGKISEPKQRLLDSLELPADALMYLTRISVSEACEAVLERDDYPLEEINGETA